MAAGLAETGEALARALQKSLDQILPDVLRRALQQGQAMSAQARRVSDGLTEMIPGVQLGRELARLLAAQVEETKRAVVRTIAAEFKDFLSATDLASELQKALANLSIELKTEIRFVPGDAGGDGSLEPRVEIRSASIGGGRASAHRAAPRHGGAAARPRAKPAG